MSFSPRKLYKPVIMSFQPRLRQRFETPTIIIIIIIALILLKRVTLTCYWGH